MTETEAKKLSEILKAFSEGKKIEMKEKRDFLWFDFDIENCLSINISAFDYRVKPESTLRPYKSSKEFLGALKEHGPALIDINDKSSYSIIPVRIWSEAFDLESSGNIGTRYKYSEIINHYKWQDGSPCGIFEDE